MSTIDIRPQSYRPHTSRKTNRSTYSISRKFRLTRLILNSNYACNKSQMIPNLKRSQFTNFIVHENNLDKNGFDEGTKVSAIHDGTVGKVINDLLGRSIFMEHSNGFITAFGHTRPLAGIKAGSKVRGVLQYALTCTKPYISSRYLTSALPFSSSTK